MSLTYEKICERIGVDIYQYLEEKYDINKEWTEDDNDDNYPLNLLSPEELEFIENHRMKLLGLV
ncbi:hypothetical protein [uncultured Granulicatella sp.]|uniref:hypothetical protein n=1 Tax=uncultured Granulicatella sp. TaxID=316089 RepID=UPI0028D2BCDA|nr:hypothetical protein [uncultured Granulicatella sp.]